MTTSHGPSERVVMLASELDACAATADAVELAQERLQACQERLRRAPGEREALEGLRETERLERVLACRERAYQSSVADLKARSRELALPKRDGLLLDPAVDPEDEDYVAKPNPETRARRLAAAAAGDPGSYDGRKSKQKRWASIQPESFQGPVGWAASG